MVSEDAEARPLRSINTKKAPNPENVSPFVLKHCMEELKSPLTSIFWQYLHTSTWHKKWKKG